MPKKIYLLRHAKSDWSNLALGDHDRPLNDRGIQAADLIGRKLAASSFSPDAVLCSTAQRAVETLDRLMTAGSFNWHIDLRRNLYHASADRLLTAIHGEDSSVDSILLVGHNPGLQDLALALVSEGDQHVVNKVRKKVPTGAFLCLEFDVADFRDITVGSGRLTSFMRPKHEFLQ